MSAEPETRALYYRCVCGEDISVESGAGANCDACGRTISAAAISSDVTQTVCLDGSQLVSNAAQISVDTADSLVGERLGHFRVVALLGSGGMGSVYRAIDESLQRFVALKVLSDSAIDKDDSEKLLQEARSQARVNHRNVVQVYYVSRDEERPFLAMEHVDGPSLRERMEVSTLSFAEIVEIALQTTRALGHSARFDIVHGDIKPANILLADGQEVKLSDFGLARRMSAKEVPEQERSISGTPSYMAPEITRGETATPQSDQYSLGVMLYQLTFDRLPFKENTDTVQQMIDAHRHKPVDFPKPWPANLPHLWRAVLHRLLAKAPADRYPTYDELARDLKGIRPLSLPAAGIVPRGLAWSVDILLALVLVGLLLLPIQIPGSRNFLARIPGLLAVWPLFICGIGVLLGWLQAATGTTLGKKIFQIGIVNRYGLRPRKSKLFWRSTFQFLPVWMVTLIEMSKMFDVTNSVGDVIFGIAVLVVMALELLFVLFRRDRRSFHDWVFGTRVALGASR